MSTRFFWTLAVVCAGVTAPVAVVAQVPEGSAIALVGGVTEYDLSGVGTRRFGAVRAQLPVWRGVLLEPGVGYMNYRSQAFPLVERTHVWTPEVQVQAELPLGRVRPYLGVGGGVAYQRLQGVSVTDPTLSGAGGVRLGLGGDWSAGAELRVRAIDPWTGSMSDLGLSLSRTLR